MVFIWAYRAGIFRHENEKTIRILKNERRAKSIFKYGLEKLSNILFFLVYMVDIEINKTDNNTVKNTTLFIFDFYLIPFTYRK